MVVLGVWMAKRAFTNGQNKGPKDVCSVTEESSILVVPVGKVSPRE